MSRKVILYIAQSLDGYIARSDGSIDWLPQDMDSEMSEFYTEFYSSIDTILMGRKTYEQISLILSPEEWPYKGIQSYIWTKNPDSFHDNDFKKFINKDIELFVQELKKQQGKDIWLVGGSELIEVLIHHDLIDKYIVTTIPKLIGSGIPLFSNIQHDLELAVENIVVSEFGIQISYERLKS